MEITTMKIKFISNPVILLTIVLLNTRLHPIKGGCKKKLFLSGPATKRGGGGKGQALRKNNFF